MIAFTRDIYGKRVRAGVHVDEEVGHVVLDIRHHRGTASRMHRADAVAMLRAMLREIAGPSIDDVRDVWDDPYAVSVHYDDNIPWCVCVEADDVPLYFEGATERDALQAAYDAGVVRRGGDAPA